MQDLISQLKRLYLLEDQPCFEDGEEGHPSLLTTVRLEQHLLGVNTVSLALLPPAGGRTIVLDFSAGGAHGGDGQWRALCAVANGLRDSLGLAAPAVSISARGFQLWLSLQAPVAVGRLVEFAGLLRRAFLADDSGNGALASVTELPPARHAGGKWSAFIHPGMGASFADEPYLEMPPPIGAQVGFLEGLASIAPAAFDDALLSLRARVGHDMQVAPSAGPSAAPSAPPTAVPTTQPPVSPEPPPPPAPGLLLKDASLEDIVRHLHARNIEPSFRYLMPPA